MAKTAEMNPAAAAVVPSGAPPLQSPAAITAQSVAFPVLVSLSFCHLLNDLIQSLIPAL